MYKILKGKKGVIGETLTWTVATVIIVVLCVLFILAAILIRGTKKFDFDIGINFHEGLVDKDISIAKSFSGFLMTENNYQDLETDIDLCLYEDFFNKVYKEDGKTFSWQLIKGGDSCPKDFSYKQGTFFDVSYKLNNKEIITLKREKDT